MNEERRKYLPADDYRIDLVLEENGVVYYKAVSDEDGDDFYVEHITRLAAELGDEMSGIGVRPGEEFTIDEVVLLGGQHARIVLLRGDLRHLTADKDIIVMAKLVTKKQGIVLCIV